MGYIRHHAIIVTAYDDDIKEAHSQALELFPRVLVGAPNEAVVNGYQSFAIFPDGSKEGWEPSEAGDAARAQFIAWLDTQRYSDGSGPYRWVEVQYGDDEGETKVCSHSDEPSRHKAGRMT